MRRFALAAATIATAIALGVDAHAATRTQAPTPAPIDGSIAIANARPQLHGVERQVDLRLPLPAKAHPRVVGLVGRTGVQIDVQLDEDVLDDALGSLEAPWRVATRPIVGGTRVVIVHPLRGVSIAAGRDREGVVVAFGSDDEQFRLHVLADDIMRPMAEPEELSAELEVWQEAERVTMAGDLPEARRRWERLVDVPRFADLATVRIAELYVASGHVNEALARLRGVSRGYPRSSGAALARLDVLQLEAITGLGIAAPEQVDIAVDAIERPRFAAYARLRAAAVLRDLDAPALALQRMPENEELPTPWHVPATALREDLLALALAAPALRGDPRQSVIHWEAWSERLGAHAERAAIVDTVAAAHEQLALFDVALPLLQERLRSGPSAVDEADVVGRLAHAYRMQGDLARANEAIDFQVAAHPDAPGLVDEIHALAITTAASDGFPAARARLVELRGKTKNEPLIRALHRSEIELALGWGTPAQIVQCLSSMPAAPEAASDPTLDPIGRRDRHELAVALVRAGRHADAVGPLRGLVDRTADPQERDRLAYHLAVAELELGHEADAVRILERIAGDGTRWGLVARARLHERRLADAVALLSTSREEPTQ
ncbi:MAG TPA: hypothetical protein VG755_22265 [Nannocystaceae bacterium]|nr:hypothetical protein [Nannocystaceae bacterium]